MFLKQELYVIYDSANGPWDFEVGECGSKNYCLRITLNSDKAPLILCAHRAAILAVKASSTSGSIPLSNSNQPPTHSPLHPSQLLQSMHLHDQ